MPLRITLLAFAILYPQLNQAEDFGYRCRQALANDVFRLQTGDLPLMRPRWVSTHAAIKNFDILAEDLGTEFEVRLSGDGISKGDEVAGVFVQTVRGKPPWLNSYRGIVQKVAPDGSWMRVRVFPGDDRRIEKHEEAFISKWNGNAIIVPLIDNPHVLVRVED